MIGHADLFDLVDWLSSVEANYKGTDCEELSILHLHSFFGNVHPGSTLTSEVQHIEVLEPIKLELSMFGSKTSSFYLKSKTIEFCIS